MSADDYAGARSEFAAEFENQLNDGLYLIKRKEVRGPRGAIPHQTAILQAGTEQERSATTTPASSSPRRSPMPRASRYASNSSSASSASRWWKRGSPTSIPTRSTSSMVKVQQALAELAVARQNRLKEEEEKLLVTARGEKEVEAKRQETLRDQIERTTQAETDKQLAVINAEREKQRAEIEKDRRTAARQGHGDRPGHQDHRRRRGLRPRSGVIADGALQPKLDALIAINKV